MNVNQSYEISEAILRKSGGSRDPEVICRCLGIELYEFDLGNLKGMYSSADRHRTIFLHKRLSEYMRRCVLAHEIAHDQIPEHRKMAKTTPYNEVQFFSDTDDADDTDAASYKSTASSTCHRSLAKNNTEREANSVAAHILIDDERMMELVLSGQTIQAIACELSVPVDLLLIELEDYGKMHLEYRMLINNLPREARGEYLKNYTDGTF